MRHFVNSPGSPSHQMTEALQILGALIRPGDMVSESPEKTATVPLNQQKHYV